MQLASHRNAVAWQHLDAAYPVLLMRSGTVEPHLSGRRSSGRLSLPGRFYSKPAILLLRMLDVTIASYIV